MFDGNFRSKRHVNLGGRSSRRSTATSSRTSSTTTTTTKTSTKNGSSNNKSNFLSSNYSSSSSSSTSMMLQEAKFMREQRAREAKQQTSSIRVQRHVRGYFGRKHLLENLLLLLQTTTTTTTPTLQASSMLLSPVFVNKVDDSVVTKIILSFQITMEGDTTTTDLFKQRLWKARLRLMRRRGGGGGGVVDESFQQLMMVPTTTETTTTTSWFGKEQLLDLIQTLQQVVVHNKDSTRWFSVVSNSILKNQHRHQNNLLDDTEVQAWLGATLLLLGTEQEEEDDESNNKMTDDDDISSSTTHSKWLASLADMLSSPPKPLPPDPSLMLIDGQDDEQEEELVAKRMVLGVMLQDKESIALKNLASHTNSTPPGVMLRLLEHILLSNNCRNILLLMQLHIQGENLSQLRKTTTTKQQQRRGYHDGWSSSSDEEDEDHVMVDVNSNNTTAKRKRSDPTRLSRLELSTMHKLDKLYKQQHWAARKELLEQLSSSSFQSQQQQEELQLLSLVKLWTSPALWNRWGSAVLLLQASDDDAAAARASYIRLLSALMKHVSGLKPKATSSFLSHLAQERPLLEGLWRNLLVIWTNHGNETQDNNNMNEFLICFCDLLAHHLIALRDDDFLAQYTITSISTTTTPVILAEHVIERIKTCLYEMYWNVPIVRSDFEQEEEPLLSNRARAMLSCTKLWNSLYERWCRLIMVRVPFVSEESWWFPKLISRFEAGAVRSTTNHSHYDDDEEAAEDALADAFADPKMARILTCIPQALPFDRRVKLFDALLKADKERSQSTEAVDGMIRRMMEEGGPIDLASVGRESLSIHRDALYKDSKEQLSTLGPLLKRRLNVTFINQHGQQEAGIDGGGIMKEFLDDLIRQAFDPNQQDKDGDDDTKTNSNEDPIPRLFDVTPLETLTVHYVPKYSKELLSHYEFLGRVLGKAVYESILVEPQFCLSFLNQLLGKQNSLEDLQNFDGEFHANLMKLRTMSANEIATLGLTFELTMPGGHSVPLLPGGSSSIPVTKATVIQYTHLVAHFRLNVATLLPTKAFLKGFRDLIPASWVRLFSCHELQKLIGGVEDGGLDVSALKRTMKYSAGYHPSQPIIQWFWEILEQDFSPSMQRKFLKFMTSCSRQPLLGFESLDPTPCIQQIRLTTTNNNADEQEQEEIMTARLPTSSTCMNLLKLPNYSSKHVLKMKLKAAIESGAGFELT